jgi:hypothetical protein
MSTGTRKNVIKRGRRLFAALVSIFGLTIGSAAYAQGVQTAEATGRVESSDGEALPGVSVRVMSPALQGVRTAVTDVNGIYAVKALPSGTYSIVLEIPDFQSAIRNGVVLTVGGT